MKNPRRWFSCCAAVAGIALLLAGNTAWSQEAVTSQEIRDKWMGKTLMTTLPNGFLAKLELRADLTAVISGSVNDVGTWRLNDPAGYCATWNRIRAREERCFTVKRKGNDYLVFNPDGSPSGTITEIR